ncbi:MAG TPA: penicillin-binding transpeptidase domain-containing protein [Bacteroidota bacterium]|nr:penicillin-binding transpeptidase domain-containing protein [Bacteroidota bacterium]
MRHVSFATDIAGALLLFALCPSGSLSQTTTETPLPAKYYHGFGGGFVLYDKNADRFTVYRPGDCGKRVTPASTFKILNSLIGLETGVIKDEHFVIPWDSVHRDIESWNRDHDLASAIANSVVPYYQELARRVGRTRMSSYIDSTGYGNSDASGPIDRFWLGSTLLISADEQVDFLRRLYDGRLPFSRRSMDIVKRILVLEHNGEYTLRGKTGFSEDRSGVLVGWFIGYVEKSGNVYFFALTMTSPNVERDGDTIRSERKAAALAILRDLGVL